MSVVETTKFVVVILYTVQCHGGRTRIDRYEKDFNHELSARDFAKEAKAARSLPRDRTGKLPAYDWLRKQFGVGHEDWDVYGIFEVTTTKRQIG